MYDELIKRLRECTAEVNGEKTLWHQAADAIDELSHIQIAPEKIIQIMWIPVTERLPKNHQHCLVFTDTHRMGYFAKNLEKVDEYDFQGEKHHGWYYLDSEWGYCEIRNVSYWMPLPQPPEDGEP